MSQTDRYGRQVNYMRISVTDRCNLRCTYCMPPEGISLMSHEDILRYEEITRLARLAYELGFTKFRITGGEPLVRKGVPDLVRELARLGNNAGSEADPPLSPRGQGDEGGLDVSKRLGIERSFLVDLSLTTNGILLAKYADDLKSAGLRRINISLDTLKREKFQRISRFDFFDDVIDGIRRSIEIGFDPIKINVVVVRRVNDDEIMDFVEMTKDQNLWVRFIELMPFSRNNWRAEDFVPADEIRDYIKTRFKLVEVNRSDASAPAVDYQVEGHKGYVGFIAPLSEKFCDLCNRLRLTADGRLLPCLHSDTEIDIKTPMRKGASDDELRSILRSAILTKPGGHTLCMNNNTEAWSSRFSTPKMEKTGRIMSKVGG